MNAKPILSLLAAASLMTACAGSSPSPAPAEIRLTAPPDALLAPCVAPRPLPAPIEDMDGATREAAWTADRINLANCRAQHAGLIAWVRGVVDSFRARRGDQL